MGSRLRLPTLLRLTIETMTSFSTIIAYAHAAALGALVLGNSLRAAGAQGAPTSAPTPCLQGPELEEHAIDFENKIAPLNLTGSRRLNEPFVDPPNRPWNYDAYNTCGGTYGLTAGMNGHEPKGVEAESILTVPVPPGAASFSYLYSHPLLTVVEFQVIINGEVRRQYGGKAVHCEEELMRVSEGDVLQFRCAIKKDKEICTIDQLQFYSSSNKRCNTESPSFSLSPSFEPSKARVSSMHLLDPMKSTSYLPTSDLLCILWYR